ncbi:MAG: LuxR C-terminal-related transcriptional regulator, partial [Candidatus Kapaibacterium sp.]
MKNTFDYLEELKKKLLNTKDKHLKINILNDLSSYVLKFDPKQSLDCAVKALTLATDVFFDKGIADSCYNCAVVYSDQLYSGKVCIKYASTALSKYRELGDELGIANTLLIFTKLAILWKNHTMANNNILQILEIANSQNHKHLLVSCSIYKGGISKNEHKYQEAIEHYNNAITLLKSFEASNSILEQEVHTQLGIVYSIIGNYTLAMSCFNLSLHLCTQLQYQNGIAYSMLCIAKLLSDQVNYELSLTYIRDSLTIYEKISNQMGIGMGFEITGDICYNMKEFSNALHYHTLAIKEFGDLQLPHGMLDIHNKIALDHIELGEYNLGLDIANDCYTQCIELNYNKGIVLSSFAKARAFRAQKKFKEATQEINESIATASSVQNNTVLPKLYTELALICHNDGNTSDAIMYLLKAESLAIEQNNLRSLFYTLYSLATTYEKNQDTTKALHYYKSFMEVKIKILNNVNYDTSKFNLTKSEFLKIMDEKQKLEGLFHELKKNEETCIAELQIIGLHLVEKQELLNYLNDQILDSMNQFENCRNCKLKTIVPAIKMKAESNKNWMYFKSKFDKAHNEFSAKLSSNFPDLTPTELKVAVLIKIQMENKDIAQLLNTSVRTIEWHRTNLRKKLGLGLHD